MIDRYPKQNQVEIVIFFAIGIRRLATGAKSPYVCHSGDDCELKDRTYTSHSISIQASFQKREASQLLRTTRTTVQLLISLGCETGRAFKMATNSLISYSATWNDSAFGAIVSLVPITVFRVCKSARAETACRWLLIFDMFLDMSAQTTPSLGSKAAAFVRTLHPTVQTVAFDVHLISLCRTACL